LQQLGKSVHGASEIQVFRDSGVSPLSICSACRLLDPSGSSW
jgi:hypothetical protein